LDLQELVVGSLLNLDQVRHRRNFANLSEEPTDALAGSGRLSHVAPRSSRQDRSVQRDPLPAPGACPSSDRATGRSPRRQTEKPGSHTAFGSGVAAPATGCGPETRKGPGERTPGADM